jgi:hypothetical protein
VWAMAKLSDPVQHADRTVALQRYKVALGPAAGLLDEDANTRLQTYSAILASVPQLTEMLVRVIRKCGSSEVTNVKD